MRPQTTFLAAVKWSYVSDLGEKCVSLGSNFVLASLLGPHAFGSVVIAATFILFVRMFLDQGLVCALIQRKTLSPPHIESVFFVNIALSFALTGICLLGSPWWARLNHAPEVAQLINVLSITIPLEALSVVPRALIQRDMDFKSLAIRANASMAISAVVGVGMALMGEGAWALVGQQISSSLVSVPLLWVYCPWRPRLGFSWPHFRDLLGFSVSNFAVQLALMVETQASSVLLGIFLGPEAVGLYRFAERLVTTVVGVTTNAVHTVSLPQFSRQQNNPDELRRSVLHCIRLSAALTLPALSGLAVAAHPLIHLVGSNWSPAADTLAILVPGAMLMIFASFAGPLLQATGDPRRLAVLEWGRAALSIVLFVIAGYIVQFHALRWQLAGFALSRFVLAAFAIAPLYILVLMRVARIPLRQFFREIMPATLASAAIVTVCLLLSNAGLVPKDRYLPQLVIETIAGGCIGAAVIFSLDSRVRDIVVSLYQRRYSLRSQ